MADDQDHADLRQRIFDRSMQVRLILRGFVEATLAAENPALVTTNPKEMVDTMMLQMKNALKAVNEPKSRNLRTIINNFTKTFVDLPKYEAEVHVRLESSVFTNSLRMKGLCEMITSLESNKHFANEPEPFVFAKRRFRRLRKYGDGLECVATSMTG